MRYLGCCKGQRLQLLVKVVADLGVIHMTDFFSDRQNGSAIETSKISEKTVGGQAVYGNVRVAGTCPQRIVCEAQAAVDI